MIEFPRTLAGLLPQELQVEPASITFIEGENDESRIGFRDLRQRALGVLHHLQQRGLNPGDEVILFTQSNEAFVDAFWACVLGGLVPVPVAVGISDDHRQKLLRIFAMLDGAFLFTEQTLARRVATFGEQTGQESQVAEMLERSITVDEIGDVSVPGEEQDRSPGDTAFIQFSSGSTSDPKGVVLTHRNVLTNIRAIGEGYGARPDDVTLSWMPLTHDMGLIGFHLCMMAFNVEHHIMDTRLFVRRPLLWLKKAGEKGATLLCSPNFGYKHCLKVFESRGLEGVDLGKVRLIFNGAEPINADIARQFMAAMAPHGLNPNAMFPVYGLAEASLGVTFPEPGAALQTVRVHRHSLLEGKPWEPASEDDPDAVVFVRLGTPVPDCELRICTEDDRVLPDGCVGHVQIRGGNVTGGYYGDAELNEAAFAPGEWLRTGDLGAIDEGQLVITGRAKDIIFVNGQNYYPHDIETVIEELEGFELGKVVAAGVTSPNAGTDELLVFVLYRAELEAFGDLARQVRGHVNERTGLEVHHVIPVARIPKTTSGKVQRHRLASDYLDGQFTPALDGLAAFADATQTTEASGDDLANTLKAICNGIVLDRPVGLDDNLFEIGISSLALAQIHAQIEERYPGQIDIADVFEYPSIRELAAFMQARES